MTGTKSFRWPGGDYRIEVIEGETTVFALSEIVGGGSDEWHRFSANPYYGHITIEPGENELEIHGVKRGNDWIVIEFDDGKGPLYYYNVPVLIYPSAWMLADASFSFDGWSFLNAENNFPDNMLFLQSDQTDPGVDAVLNLASFIPSDDYADGDPVGYPYAATRRTRINGLDDRGVSFVNTGRERDLGGAVVALDTLGLAKVAIERTAGTEAPNEQRMGPVDLPSDALDQPYVQLLFRYYHVSGESGPRAELRLDDIDVYVLQQNISFADWRETAFTDLQEREDEGISGPFADRWLTGYSNLFRYAFDLAVDEARPASPLQVDFGEDGNHLRLLAVPGRKDIEARLHRSEDLLDWSEVLWNSGQTSEPLNANGEWEFFDAVDEEVDAVYYRIEVEMKE